MLTRTAQGIPGGAINVGLVGSREVGSSLWFLDTAETSLNNQPLSANEREFGKKLNGGQPKRAAAHH